MTEIKQCDRCKGTASYLYPTTITSYKHLTNGTFRDKQLHLCDVCTGLFKDWLNIGT